LGDTYLGKQNISFLQFNFKEHMGDGIKLVKLFSAEIRAEMRYAPINGHQVMEESVWSKFKSPSEFEMIWRCPVPDNPTKGYGSRPWYCDHQNVVNDVDPPDIHHLGCWPITIFTIFKKGGFQTWITPWLFDIAMGAMAHLVRWFSQL
jgi:hypothetical protein